MNKATKVIEGVVTEFTKNVNGVSIKKCCASCETHTPYDSEGPRRKCTKHNKVVDKGDCCSDWCMSDTIKRLNIKRH